MIYEGAYDSRIPLQGVADTDRGSHGVGGVSAAQFGKRLNNDMFYTISLDISFNWRDLI